MNVYRIVVNKPKPQVPAYVVATTLTSGITAALADANTGNTGAQYTDIVNAVCVGPVVLGT